MNSKGVTSALQTHWSVVKQNYWVLLAFREIDKNKMEQKSRM